MGKKYVVKEQSAQCGMKRTNFCWKHLVTFFNKINIAILKLKTETEIVTIITIFFLENWRT